MYAFVHIEKTAGTTLNSILRRSFGTGHCDIRLPLAKRRDDHEDHRVTVEAADLHRVRRLYRRLTGIAGHNVKPYADLERECPEIRYFTVLRDPVARFRSHFLHKAPDHSPQTFDRWASASWAHNWQTKMIAGEPNTQKAIDLLSTRIGFVGFTERFDESLVMLGRWLAELRFRAEYRALNRSSEKQRPQDLARKQADMEYLRSDAVRARIQDLNAEDQKVYDYAAQVLYPRQVAAHPGDLAAQVAALQQHNRSLGPAPESMWSRLMRNYVYKPLLHCYVI